MSVDKRALSIVWPLLMPKWQILVRSW